jgi:hypothetical protein
METSSVIAPTLICLVSVPLFYKWPLAPTLRGKHLAFLIKRTCSEPLDVACHSFDERQQAK